MLTLSQVSKTFSGGFKPVLTNMNLQLKQGDFCVVIGSNGSGKSTLMKIIAGEYKPDTGKILLEDEDVTKQDRNKSIAAVTQDVNQGTIPEMTLLENMTLSLTRTKRMGFSFYKNRANQVIQEVQALGIGLEQYLHYPLSHLSGGQRQMVATIMAMTSTPKLVLLDEHTSALAPCAQRMVMTYTAQAIAKQRLTSLMVTHNLSDALHYGNRLLMLHQGQIVFDVANDAKANLTVNELLALFHRYEDSTLLETPL